VIIENEGANDNPDPLDEAPDPPDEVVTQLGDVWVMGSHRLICGNALEAETYNRLMGPKLARMILTDPPCNIKIAGNVSGKGVVKHGEFDMASVEMSSPDFTQFLETALMGSTPRLVEGGLVFVFMDRRHCEELLRAARETGLSLLDLCIWDKMNGGMGSMWRSRHEPCFVFKKGKEPHINNIQLGKHGRYRTNIWEHRGLSSFGKGRTEALHDHPTQKPVNLLAEAIKDCTRRGDIILDNFVGSGSTLLAAEKTGRIGYGVELEPKFVDVCVTRWQKMTGRAAVLDGTEMTFANVRAMRHAKEAKPGPETVPGPATEE
jgi:DNA modification methylase